MKNLDEIERIIKSRKKELEEKFKVKNIAIFGSYVRAEQNKESDIDILVEFKEPVGFLFIHLADYLEELLGVKVDLLTPDAIKPNRRKYIMEDLVYV
ncbi:MAG: nucleotidyltransferase family protein [bacterium]|nr:nucleotidyltransferase family protein [bacterium]